MLLFELSGVLFQLEAREPAFEPLFQFAPSSTAAACPRLNPVGLYVLLIRPNLATHHIQKRFRCFMLVIGEHS